MSQFVLRQVIAPSVGQEAVDITVADGRIAAISPSDRDPHSGAGAEAAWDGAGLVALPAFVDLHTHIREPGKEAAETSDSASRSALAGGYCVIHAMANTTPVADSPAAVESVWRRGREVGLVGIRPVGAVTMGLSGAQLAPIAQMHDTEAAPTVFSDDGHCVERADLMRAALRAVRRFDGVIAQHAQESTLTAGAQMNEGDVAVRLGLPGWPAVAESAMVARDVMLAADTDARLHVCHVSSAQTVAVLRWAKSRGVRVTAEVTPHHLLLTDEQAATGDAVYKVNPPLRSRADVEAVREALADGTIDVVATDHAPHEASHKSCAWSDAAMGMVGLETAFSIVHEVMVASGLMGWDRLVAAMSTVPADIGSVRAPEISLGAPADFVLVDPAAVWSVEPAAMQSLSRNTPFAGRALLGSVVMNVRDGQIAFVDETARAAR